MKRSIVFVTGTDTGVGKTAITRLLTAHLRASGKPIAALKPLCSGDRCDAQALHSALNGTLNLDEINPWFFDTPLAPLIAARKRKRRVMLNQVMAHVRAIHHRFPAVIIEGAGGLLSPLGEDFNARNLIHQLRAVPIVVCPNRLGAINQVLLVLDALNKRAAAQAQIVLITPKEPDSSHDTNLTLLREFAASDRIHLMPWTNLQRPRPERRVHKILQRLTATLFS